MVVLRGMGAGKGGNRNPPFPAGSFAPFWPLRKGPAGGMTRKQIRKRFPWKAFQPGIRRADVGIGPYGAGRAAIKAAPTSVLNGRYGRERQAGAAGALRSKPPPPEDHQENSLGEVPRRGNRNSPFLAVSRGGLLRRGKSESPALTGSFAPFWPLRKGPAGGLTRKQVSKRVPMEGAPARHKAGRCRQKVNCLREAKEAAPTVERTAHKTQPVSGPYLRRNTWTRKEARTRRPSRAASRSAPSLGVFQ